MAVLHPGEQVPKVLPARYGRVVQIGVFDGRKP
jgi:hypothetical protein